MAEVLNLNQQVQNLLNAVPASQRTAAEGLVIQWGPQLFQMAQDDAWQYLRRLLAGDLQAVADLDSKLSTDDFVAKVKANTAAWANVEQYNQVRANMGKQFLLAVAPVVASILMALVGL